jgi:hypothetical protein
MRGARIWVARSYKSQSRAGVAACGNAEILALELVWGKRGAFSLEMFVRQRTVGHVGGDLEPDPAGILVCPGGPKWIGSAPGRRKHGEPRLRLSRPHRPNGGKQVVREPRRFIGNDPAVHGQAADRIVRAGERQDPRTVLQFKSEHIVAVELRFGCEQGRMRRTASALWRCAGQTMTDRLPG